MQFEPEEISTNQLTSELIESLVPGYTVKSVRRLVDDETIQKIKERKQKAGTASQESIDHRAEAQSRLVVLEFENVDEFETIDIAEALNQDNTVKLAELSHQKRPLAVIPNDNRYLDQDIWGLHWMKVDKAWNFTTGSEDVIVAIIDSGIRYDHEDLEDNIYINLSSSDDGIDLADDDENPIDPYDSIEPIDETYGLGHGTQVAGVIGAVGNNEIGLPGVNWDVNFLICKVMPDSEAAEEDPLFDEQAIIDCINWAVGEGAHIINMSLGSPIPQYYEEEAIEDAMYSDVLCVVAAGNEGTDNDGILTMYPASYDLDNIIAVAAAGSHEKELAEWIIDEEEKGSNYGATTVDLVAPGQGINTTNYLTTTSYKTSMFGTSFATPYVTGVAALLKAYDSDLTYSQIKSRILDNVDKWPALDGKVLTEGFLNACAAISPGCFLAPEDLSDPLAPKNTVVVREDSDIKLNVIGANGLMINSIELGSSAQAGDYTIQVTGTGSVRTATLKQNGVTKATHDYYWQTTVSTTTWYTFTFGSYMTIKIGRNSGSRNLYNLPTDFFDNSKEVENTGTLYKDLVGTNNLVIKDIKLGSYVHSKLETEGEEIGGNGNYYIRVTGSGTTKTATLRYYSTDVASTTYNWTDTITSSSSTWKVLSFGKHLQITIGRNSGSSNLYDLPTDFFDNIKPVKVEYDDAVPASFYVETVENGRGTGCQGSDLKDTKMWLYHDYNIKDEVAENDDKGGGGFGAFYSRINVSNLNPGKYFLKVQNIISNPIGESSYSIILTESQYAGPNFLSQQPNCPDMYEDDVDDYRFESTSIMQLDVPTHHTAQAPSTTQSDNDWFIIYVKAP